jgi:hypothetical protein
MKAGLNGNRLLDTRVLDDRLDLLAEWTAERKVLRRGFLRLNVYIALAALTTCSVFPIAQRLRGAALQEIAQDKTELQFIAQRIARAKRLAPAVSPSGNQAIAQSLVANFDSLTGHLYAILNMAEPGMALSHVSAQAQSGEIEIRCQGDAENFAVASQFAEKASGANSGSGNLSATRPNRAFGEHGVEFEYLRKVKLP